MVEHSTPGIEGFPGGCSFAEIIRQRKYDVMDLLPEVGVFDHVDGFMISFYQVVQVEVKILQGSMPARVVGNADNVEVYPAGDHVAEPESIMDVSFFQVCSLTR